MRRPRRPLSELQRPASDLLLEQFADQGLSKQLSDNAFWLPENTDWSMINALQAFDQHGDKRPLLELLRERGEVFLADFLERYELRRKPHRPRAPAYDKTPIERRIAGAVRDVRVNQVEKRTAAERWRIDIRALETRLAGKRGATRRHARRLRP